MGDDKRLRREDPARTAPIRNFSGLYQPLESESGQAAATNAGAAPQNLSASGGARFADSPSTNGVAPSHAQLDRERAMAGASPAAGDEGVGLAYRVIEEHISEGRRNAGQFNSQPYNTRALTDGFQVLLERTLRYGSELFPLWLEALSSAVRYDQSRMPFPPGAFTPSNDDSAQRMNSGPASRQPPPYGSTAISIEMISTRPVQVSIDMRENSENLPLVSLGLHEVDPNKRPLRDISFIPEPSGAGASIKLRISIPDDHPQGSYSGVIVNRDTGETHGTLTVRIAQ